MLWLTSYNNTRLDEIAIVKILFFQQATSIYIYIFPYVVYPGKMIMMSASIFMTVAISMERYLAVHYPIDYRQVKYFDTSFKYKIFCQINYNILGLVI